MRSRHQTGPSPLINDSQWVDRVKSAAAANFLVMKCNRAGTSRYETENFAFVMQKAPGVFVRFGSQSEGAYGGS